MQVFDSAARAEDPALIKSVRYLEHSDLDTLMQLQAIVHQSLPDDRKHHMRMRSRENFEMALDHSEDRIIGVYVGEDLAAATLLHCPSHAEDASGFLRRYNPPWPPEKLAVMAGVVRNGAYRGLGLARTLFQESAALARAGGRESVLAVVKPDNIESMTCFCSYGFRVHHTGWDPAEGRHFNILAGNVRDIQTALSQGPRKNVLPNPA